MRKRLWETEVRKQLKTKWTSNENDVISVRYVGFWLELKKNNNPKNPLFRRA